MARYLFKLNAALSEPAQIQTLFDLSSEPEVLPDENNPSIRFIIIDGVTRNAIASYLVPGKGLFIPLPASASKNLSDSKTLGGGALSCPGQDDYPVPYFFYGTLADREKSQDVIGLDEPPELVEARVKEGKVKMWGRTFRAIVDGEKEDMVEGEMYVVRNQEEEDALRHYEGAIYEVVRCLIEF